MQTDDIVDYLNFQLLQNEDLFDDLSRKWRLVDILVWVNHAILSVCIM